MANIVPPADRSVQGTARVRGACSITLLLALMGSAALVVGVAGGHRSAMSLGLLAFCLYLLVGTGVVPRAIAGRLQRPFALKHPRQATFGRSVCIILLVEPPTSDPRTREHVPNWISGPRVATAAGLHRLAIAAGAQSQIVIAGERIRSTPRTFPSIYARSLAELGVADSDVRQETDGVNTYQHARNIAALVRVQPAATTYLVTSALHMKRALLYFAAFGLRPDPFPSDYVHVPCQLLPVGYNFAVADIAAHQYIGILRFHCYELLGLNRRPASLPHG